MMSKEQNEMVEYCRRELANINRAGHFSKESRNALACKLCDLVIKDYSPVPISMPEPKEVAENREFKASQDYKYMTFEEKDKFDKKYRAREDVQEFMKHRWEVIRTNRDNLLFLSEMYAELTDKDIIIKERFRKKMSELFNVVKRYNDIEPALALDLAKFAYLTAVPVVSAANSVDWSE